jgi:DNA invertase Pin-like site-specific DNA recombinase
LTALVFQQKPLRHNPYVLFSLLRIQIIDRTKAGMARAKSRGIKIGRPRLGIEVRQKIAQRAAKGETPYAIAMSLGIERHTAANYAGPITAATQPPSWGSERRQKRRRREA